MALAIRGNNQVSGTWGQFWWNGHLILEIQTFEAKVIANREEVSLGMSKDSKITSLSGEGTFAIKKFFTRGKKEILEAWKRGEDPRATFIAKVQDPDAKGKQSERVSIDNVWFNELLLLQFEKGTPSQEEFSFGFTPEDASFVDIIAA